MSTLHYYRLLMPSHPARTEERIEIRRSDEMAHMQALIQPFNLRSFIAAIRGSRQCRAGVAQWQFSDVAKQKLWDVLGSNPVLHP